MKKRFFSLLFLPLFSIAQITLDSSFGVNGFTYIDLPSIGIARMYTQLQSDGKIIVSGNHINGSISREDYILRLSENGNLDASYGENGYHILPNIINDIDGPDIYILPDDKIISFSNNTGSSLIKLDQQGNLDPGFTQNAGYSPFDSQEFSLMNPQRDLMYFYAPQQLGWSGLQRIHTTTGALDTTFGNALHTLVMPTFFNPDCEAAIQSDGKITMILEASPQCYVHRILSDGTADPSFGTNGSTRIYGMPEVSTTDFSNREECMVYDEFGALYVVSRNWETFDQTTIYKLGADGQPVLSFGIQGSIVLPENDFVLDVYIHDGSLYTLGRRILTNSFNDCNLLLAKYDLDGTPDPNFGINGTYVEESNPYLESGEDLVFTNDGSLIVVGETNEGVLHRPFAAKYNNQALQSQTFTKNTILYTNPVTDILTVKGDNIIQIQLFGIDGKEKCFTSGNTIKMSNYNSGSYLAKIIFKNGDSQNIKIIKK